MNLRNDKNSIPEDAPQHRDADDERPRTADSPPDAPADGADAERRDGCARPPADPNHAAESSWTARPDGGGGAANPYVGDLLGGFERCDGCAANKAQLESTGQWAEQRRVTRRVVRRVRQAAEEVTFGEGPHCGRTERFCFACAISRYGRDWLARVGIVDWTDDPAGEPDPAPDWSYDEQEAWLRRRDARRELAGRHALLDDRGDDLPRDARVSAHDVAVLRRHYSDLAASAADAGRAHAEARLRALTIDGPWPADVDVLGRASGRDVGRAGDAFVGRHHVVAISRREARLLAAGWSGYLAESEWADRMEQVSVSDLMAGSVAWRVLDSLEEQGFLTRAEVAAFHRECRARHGLDLPWVLDAHGVPYDPRQLPRPLDPSGYTGWAEVWAGPRDSAQPWPGEACDDAGFDDAAGRASVGEAP